MLTTHVPYYRRTLELAGVVSSDGRVDLANFERIPLLDKPLIREHFDELASDDLAEREVGLQPLRRIDGRAHPHHPRQSGRLVKSRDRALRRVVRAKTGREAGRSLGRAARPGSTTADRTERAATATAQPGLAGRLRNDACRNARVCRRDQQIQTETDTRVRRKPLRAGEVHRARAPDRPLTRGHHDVRRNTAAGQEGARSSECFVLPSSTDTAPVRPPRARANVTLTRAFMSPSRLTTWRSCAPDGRRASPGETGEIVVDVPDHVCDATDPVPHRRPRRVGEESVPVWTILAALERGERSCV